MGRAIPLMLSVFRQREVLFRTAKGRPLGGSLRTFVFRLCANHFAFAFHRSLHGTPTHMMETTSDDRYKV